ncbi:MAG TPA: DUF971 domain-containing protein [Phycisphaerae bacterium]|nr:DUF971 domain-containing protein [Phycisphaerae bacterium]
MAQENIPQPTDIKLKKSESLQITWSDGQTTRYELRMLRRMCPCAGCRGERDLLGRQLLPVVKTSYDGPITAVGAELVGNYALRIIWSDNHTTGIYTFEYLRSLESV